MSKFLVNSEERIPIEVFFGTNESGAVSAASSISDLTGIPTPEKAVFFFRRPNHKDSNTILSIAGVSENGIKNIILFNSAIINTLLFDWDVTGDDGKKIPFAKQSISNIDPAIVRVAIENLLSKVNIL